MAWRIYIQHQGDTERVPREFKTRADAEMFWRRNWDNYTRNGKKGSPIYVETGKGRNK